MPYEFLEREGIFCYGELLVSELTIRDPRRMDRIRARLGTVASAILFFLPYHSGQTTGLLSVYAQPRDYHEYLRLLGERLEEELRERRPGLSVFVCGDTSPLCEVTDAVAAGLGVRGDNGLLLNPRYGSYGFLGEIFLSEPISPRSRQEEKGCRHCKACLRACPTGAVTDPCRRECLSLLTQKKHLSPREEELVRRAACKWGCDLCQTVCPYNREAEQTPIPYFREDLVLSPEDFCREAEEEEFRRRAFSWRGREVLLRNLSLTDDPTREKKP